MTGAVVFAQSGRRGPLFARLDEYFVGSVSGVDSEPLAVAISINEILRLFNFSGVRL